MAGTGFRPLMARGDRSAARTPRTRLSLSSRGKASSRATGCPAAAWWTWQAIWSDCDGPHSGLVRYLGRVFGNQGTVGRDLDEDLRGYAVDKRRIRATGGVAAAAAGFGDRAMDGQNRARHSGKPVGLAGDKRAAMSKKDLASDRCLSLGRR